MKLKLWVYLLSSCPLPFPRIRRFMIIEFYFFHFNFFFKSNCFLDEYPPPPPPPLKKKLNRSNKDFCFKDLPSLHGLININLLFTDSAPLSYKEDLLAEINLMKKIGSHPNIVSMSGACTLSEPIALVMEYVPYGNLQNFLK